jgi:hypothetical protein
VPIDFFSPTGAPLGYLIGRTPSGDADRPVVYGIDSDQKRYAVPKQTDLPNIPQLTFSQSLWQFRDLSRWYPVRPTTQPAPSSQAPDH